MAEMKITAQNFEADVMNSELPVLLDFWASWCGPCRMLAPELSAVAEAYQGKVRVGKVNVDEEGELAMKFRVSSIPMLVLMKNGEIVKKQIGFCPRAEIENMLR